MAEQMKTFRWIKMGGDDLRLETSPLPQENWVKGAFQCDLCSQAIRAGQWMAQYYSGDDAPHEFAVCLHTEHLEVIPLA